MSFMVDPSLAGWAGLHAAIVDNKAMPAPARDDPVFRHFLSAPGATPGIDGGGGVEPPPYPTTRACPQCFTVLPRVKFMPRALEEVQGALDKM
ncbi:MAG: hypothetical protein H6976_11210 [Gammaproteobacteria bacterium]|nr:hypothetical protein [Gammaproteobacteria bacterium]